MRRAEIATGILFILSTAAFMAGSGMLDPILQQVDLLDRIDAERTTVYAAMFLELINAIAVVGIAMLLQPVLRKYHESFAFGYFASRVMESALLILSLSIPLMLLVLSEGTALGGTSGDSSLQVLGSVAVEAHYLLFDMGMLVLGAGSLLFCYILYRARLVPRLLAVIGVVGYICLLVSSSLSIAGVDAGATLFIPGAIFEIALPIWLIVKGFNRHTREPA